MEANSSDLSLLDDIDKEILILSIDIGDGRRDIIKVHEKSSVDKLAIEFCSKHKLGAKAKIALADEIEKKLEPAGAKKPRGNKCTPAVAPAAETETVEEEVQFEPEDVKAPKKARKKGKRACGTVDHDAQDVNEEAGP